MSPSSTQLRIAFVLLGWCAAWTAGIPAAFASDESPIAEVVVLPFSNLSDNPDARAQIMPYVYFRMAQAGFQPAAPERVAQSLREHRIRVTSRISRQDAQAVCSDLGTPWILLGSVDLHQEDEHGAHAGFSARLFNCLTGEVVWADSRYAAGEDFAGILGIGKIEHATDLSDRLILDLSRSLRRQWLKHPERMYDPEGTAAAQPTVILIPFSDLTEAKYASEILDNVLVGELIRKGYRVIEPGIVHHQLLSHSVLPRGEIDLPTLRTLAEHFQVDYCLTGMISLYRMAPVEEGELEPRVEMEARLLEAATGKLLWADHCEHLGSDFARLFQIGWVYSPGKLLQVCVQEMLDSLPHKD